MKQYQTISELRANANGHFFDRSSMRFFNSRILPKVYRGVYFITSEKHRETDPRLFTVRMSLNGSIETIGKFQVFDTAREASAFIKSLPEYLPHALELATNDFNGKPLQGIGFVDSALIEPSNNENGAYSTYSFTGACTWLIHNYTVIDSHFIRHFADIYNERLKATA